MTNEQQIALAQLKAAAFDAAQAILVSQTQWQETTKTHNDAYQVLIKAKKTAEDAVKAFELANAGV